MNVRLFGAAAFVFSFAFGGMSVYAATARPAPVFQRVPAAPAQLLFVADYIYSSVDIYSAGRKPKFLSKIKAGVSYPKDVFVDEAGSLYVLNQGSTVSIYARGETSPKETFSTGGQFEASNITVAPDGTIGVAGFANGGKGFAAEFSGNGQLKRTIAVGSQGIPSGIAIDAAGDIYVAVNADVFVYAAAQAMPIADLKQPSITGAIALERDGRLLVGLPYANAVAIESLPGGKVVRRITTAGAGDFIALDRDAGILYVVSAVGGTLQYYNYRTGAPIGFTTGIGSGIAVAPRGQR